MMFSLKIFTLLPFPTKLSHNFFIFLRKFAKIVDFFNFICYSIRASFDWYIYNTDKVMQIRGSGSVVERCLAKANVAGSNPVFRSKSIWHSYYITTFAKLGSLKIFEFLGCEENLLSERRFCG